MTSPRPATFDDLKRRRWELLALTSVGAFINPFLGAVTAVALPAISRDLGLSFSASMWVQAAYLIVMAALLIPLGRLADERGRVRFYLIGIAVFSAGSLLCAVSPERSLADRRHGACRVSGPRCLAPRRWRS